MLKNITERDLREKIIYGLLDLFSLVGCVRTGIMIIEKGSKEPLMGSATGSLVIGSFYVENTTGLECKGSYNPLNMDPLLDVSLKYNDGKTGSARVLKTGTNLTNGSGSGDLSDGTEFKILLGDMIHYAGAEGYWHKD